MGVAVRSYSVAYYALLVGHNPLCSKLCWHNLERPILYHSHCTRYPQRQVCHMETSRIPQATILMYASQFTPGEPGLDRYICPPEKSGFLGPLDILPLHPHTSLSCLTGCLQISEAHYVKCSLLCCVQHSSWEAVLR